MKNLNVWSLIVGIAILILALVLRALTELSLFFYTALLNAGFIFIGYSVYLSNLPRDERSKRIGARSFAWSWMVTFIVLVILFWNYELRPDSLTVSRVLWILYCTMLVSTAICYRWLNHWDKVE